MQGSSESTIQSGEKLISIPCAIDRLPPDMDRIEHFKMISPPRVAIPLKNLATVERTARAAGTESRRVAASGGFGLRAYRGGIGSTIRDIQAKLHSNLALPKGVRLEFGGVYQTQQESFRDLLMVAAAAIILVFIVLLFEFGEFRRATGHSSDHVTGAVRIPCGASTDGNTFNISSFVGVNHDCRNRGGECGVRDATVALRQSEGDDLDTAIITASVARTRPILMTTLAAVLALLPLALGIGGGAQMQAALGNSRDRRDFLCRACFSFSVCPCFTDSLRDPARPTEFRPKIAVHTAKSRLKGPAKAGSWHSVSPLA